MTEPQKAVSLTPEQLQEMFVTMAKELRRPADPTAEEAATKEMDKQMRADRAAAEVQKIESRKLEQSMCDHSREDGTGACVPVYGDHSNVEFLICQACQALIHPEPRPEGKAGKESEQHVYSTQIFNREYRRASRRPSALFQ